MTPALTRADVDIVDQAHPAPTPQHEQWLVRIGHVDYVISAFDYAFHGRPLPRTVALPPGIPHNPHTEYEPIGISDDVMAMWTATKVYALDHEACIVRLICHLNWKNTPQEYKATRRARWFELGTFRKPDLVALWHQANLNMISYPPVGTRRAQEIAGEVFRAEYPQPPCVYCGEHPQDTGHACSSPNVIVNIGI